MAHKTAPGSSWSPQTTGAQALCGLLLLLLGLVASPLRAAPAFSEVFAEHAASMLLIDPENGVIRDANPAAARFYGYPLQSLRSMKIHFINTLAPAQVDAEIARARSGERDHFLFRHRLASGEVRKVAVWSTPFVFEGETLLLSIITDLTEMREADDPFWHYQSGLEDKLELQSSQIQAFVAQIRAQDRRIILVLALSLGAMLWLIALLIKDVRRRQRAEASAQQLLEKNAQANAVLQRFTEVAAHHLQEPCRRMVSYAGLIRRRLAQQAEAAELEQLSQTLEAQALRQRTLVRDMQLFLAAGQASAERSVAEPAVLIERIFAELPTRESAAPVELILDALLPLPLDPNWLSHCLSCILSNALEHSDPEQPLTIEVSSRIEAGRLQLVIADNGPGIPEAYLERVFGVFEQLQPPTGATHTGIGLAIVRRIMETIGGRAQAERSPAGGTQIILEFPSESRS
jgi:PAS domain S-box-containing protein